VVRTSCQWENLPKDFPNYNSVYYHYRKWCKDGTWQLERTFAWLGRYRRLSKDYEKCTRSSEGVVYLASIHTMLKRIAAAP
jgi:transposase